MTAALALLVLLTITLTLVRIAGVALRLTGVPKSVARFQAISALTGAGYTTSESEPMMHQPARRRILVMLMCTGNLGLVSMASTIILAMGSAEESGGYVFQIAAFLAAILALVILARSQTLDRVMCSWMAQLLVRLGWIENDNFEVLHEDASGHQLREYVITPAHLSGPHLSDLSILVVNGVACSGSAHPVLNVDDHIIAYGPPFAHFVGLTGNSDWINE